jgi:hypothetical protein
MVGQVGATLRENSALVEKQPYVPNADVMRSLPRLDQPSLVGHLAIEEE